MMHELGEGVLPVLVPEGFQRQVSVLLHVSASVYTAHSSVAGRQVGTTVQVGSAWQAAS